MAAEVDHIGAVAVGPTGFAVGMVVGHTVGEVVVGSIGSVVVPGRGTETLVMTGSQETEAVDQAEGEGVCYILAALGDMVMRVRHMEPEEAVVCKVTAAELAIRGARVVVVVQALAGFGHTEVVAQNIVMVDRRCSYHQGWRMRSSRRAAYCCG